MDLDLARELYFRELDSKADQDARLGVYAALFSVIGAALAVLVRWAWPPSSTLSLVGFWLSILAAVVYVGAVVWVLRVVGFNYKKLPSPDDLLAYRRGLDVYYAGNPKDPGNASEDFDDYLLRQFAHAATVNSANNIVRSKRFYQAGVMLLVVVVLAAISASALGVNQARDSALLRGGHHERGQRTASAAGTGHQPAGTGHQPAGEAR